MFDFGFWELILVMLVALVVVGPQRLPRLASQVGSWIGKMRSMIHQLRQNIEQEAQTEELREVLREQQNQIEELRDIVQESGASDPVVGAIERQLEESAQTDTGATPEDEHGRTRSQSD